MTELESTPADHAERRDAERRSALISRISEEFYGVAGLTLTEPQACRLFQLPLDQCHRILQELERAHVLARDRDGNLVRGERLLDPADAETRTISEPKARRS